MLILVGHFKRTIGRSDSSERSLGAKRSSGIIVVL